MKAITFNIRLLEPLLATQVNSGDENSATAYNFIPGSIIRGALAGRYLRQHSTDDPAEDAEFRRLFLEGDVRFLNGYPAYYEDRMLPAPFSWYMKKGEQDNEQGTIFDFANEEKDIKPSAKNPNGDFCHLMGESAILKSPARQVNIHTSSEDRNTRSKDSSTVYRYEAIAAEEVFSAVIVFETDTDASLIQNLLSDSDLALGGAQTAGYGRVRLENVNQVIEWTEYQTNTTRDDEIIITLLSDVIVRGPDGHNATNFDQVLAQALDLKQLSHSRAYQKVHLVGGFNRKWGLPLPQTWALQAGSVFVYPAENFDLTTLQTLESQGIGERVAEGFGRFAVNWHTQPKLERISVEPRSQSSIPKLIEDSESYKIAQRIASHLLKVELEVKLIETINTLSGQLRLHGLSNAQISRLRLMIRQAWIGGDLNPIKAHLEGLKSAKRQWEQARLGNKSLKEWIADRVQEKDTWQQLQFASRDAPSIAGVTASIEALRVPYMARLIDGVLENAMKQKDKDERRSA